MRTPRLHHHRRPPRAPIEPIDLNTADADAFVRIPGIDRRLAERIVAFRALNGPFESLDELGDVDGFSSRRVDHLAPYLLVR